MGSPYNDKDVLKPSAERVTNRDAALNSQEEAPPTPSLKLDKTQYDDAITEEKRSEKTQNCMTWSQNLLKSARISNFTQEYRSCKGFKPDVKTTISDKMSDKNRYSHILCANENRVVLKDRPSSDDYIHASWMEMPDGVQFISTQGPIKNTIADFWHMIYTEKCSVIVMLCHWVEDEQEKCQKYFSEKSEMEYGDYKVKVVEKTVELFNPVKMTTIQVTKKNSSVKHTVYHYWYQDWQDQVAPLDPAPMIKTYKAILKKNNSKPIVVHCSAGVGRTATFVGIHLGYVMIRENSGVQMTEILKRLRKMRLGAIQSQLQYVFLICLIIQLFIDNKIVKRDAPFELLLKKYADVTRKVTEAILKEKEETQKKRKKEEAREAKEQEREAQWEKFREREREEKRKENEKKNDDKEKDTKKEEKKEEKEAPALREEKKKEKTLETPSRPAMMRRDPPSRPGRRPSCGPEEKTSREAGSKYEGSIAEERSRNPKQRSVYVKLPLSSKEKRSKHETQKTKNKKNTARKTKKKPSWGN